MKLEKLMSNEIKSGNVNEQSGAGKNDSNRTTEAPKSAQQSQGTTRPGEKSSSQLSGSDQKSGQQSQAVSRADDDGMKQAGSNLAKDPKKTPDAGQQTGATK
jgi:hypothetical protein